MRKYTNALEAAIEEGLLDPLQVAQMALGAMSEDDVAEMCRANDISDEFLRVDGPTELQQAYEFGACPDCSEDIPSYAVEGDECGNCGHVFYLFGADNDNEPDIPESLEWEDFDPDC
jgi:hypothetical protein